MELARAFGAPPLAALLKADPADFIVVEDLGFVADGAGEHVLLRVRKEDLTTPAAADILARFAGVRPLQVGWAGLKDRHAVTEQHFSVQLAGRAEPDWSALDHPGLVVLEHARHGRKLKRGALAGNRFVITLREVEGERARAEALLARLAREGAPNYFGSQRFGHGGGNVAKARAMFAGRRVGRAERGILLSAVRAEIFNAVLDARVRDGSWNRGLPGELWSLAGSRAWFGPEPDSPDLAARLAAGDIHTSGPLWGRGPSPAGAAAAELENRIVEAHAELCEGLAAAGLEHARRALRLLSAELSWEWLAEDVLRLRFRLPPGSYATTLLGELAVLREPATRT